MRTTTTPVARAVTGLLVSVLAGLLLAALLFPVIGGAGLVAKAGADDFLQLPAELTTEQVPTRTRILDANGGLLATLFLENRVNVPLSIVPVHVRDALIAIEDSRFYEHNGIDLKGSARALLRNTSSGGVQQGGSTLTQQYVKNALLAAARDKAGQRKAVEQSLDRKLKEARYALALEQRLSKDEILNRYLNIAYFGNGAYGIGAAAQYYFGKPVQRLTIVQGAMLAGMVQNPSRFDPTDREKAPGVLARRNLVLRRMADLGKISERTRAQGSALPLALSIHPVGNGCGSGPVGARAFFCDYVRRELEGTDVGKALGATLEERQTKLLGGGLTIRTTLDPTVLAAAQSAVEARVPADDPSGARAVADVVEPGTGHIKALAVNAVYGEKKGQTKVNYAVGGTYGFQGGSTFKAFVLAAAVQQGIPLGLTLYAPQSYTSTVFKDYVDGRIGPYTLSNAGDSEAGTFDLRTATADSVNTYYIQLEERTGVEQPASIAESLGVRRVRDEKGGTDVPLQRGGSFVLGASEVSPLAMSGAYAALAAHGRWCRPQAVLSIVDGRGRPVDVPAPECTQALSPEVADTVTDVLRGVVEPGGSALRTGLAAYFGRPVAGKTGTTDSSKSAWFVGFTPQLATAVWVGQPDRVTGAPLPMRRVVIGGRYFDQVFGGTIPAAIFRLTMQGALDGQPVAPFVRGGSTGPDPSASPAGPQVQVPDLRGVTVAEASQKLRDAGFVPAQGDPVQAGYVPPGTVAYTTPGRKETAPQGAPVTIHPAR